MSTKVDELKLDIEELNNLVQQATRQKSKDLLGLEIRKLQTELLRLIQDTVEVPVKPSISVSDTTNKCYEVKLNNYGWDQTSTVVKLYVTLKGVHGLAKEAITCDFTERSCNLRALGLDNKNYTLTINNLCEEIDTSKSNFKVKTDMVIVSLAKKVDKHWSYVTGVEKKIKEAKTSAIPDIKDNSNPASSLMSLMEKMYVEGDDEMKQRIAKIWTESQEKKASGIFNDYP